MIYRRVMILSPERSRRIEGLNPQCRPFDYAAQIWTESLDQVAVGLGVYSKWFESDPRGKGF